LLEESDNDLSMDPKFSILATNQRIRTNETNRTWIGTITQDRR